MYSTTTFVEEVTPLSDFKLLILKLEPSAAIVNEEVISVFSVPFTR